MKWHSEEHAEQEVIADFFGNALRAPTSWTGIDHANARNKLAGVSRKLRGVKAGIEDFQIIHRLEPRGSLVICLEVKRRKTAGKSAGRQSDKQTAWQVERERSGCVYRVIETVEEARDILRELGVPLHAQLMGSRAMLVAPRG